MTAQRHFRRAWLGRCEQRGQATVEFIMVLPAVVLVVLLILQSMVVSHDVLVVSNAAREAARAAAVDPSGADSQRIVARSMPGAVVVVTRSMGSPPMVTATVTYRSKPSLPLIGPMLPSIVITRRVTMRAET